MRNVNVLPFLIASISIARGGLDASGADPQTPQNSSQIVPPPAVAQRKCNCQGLGITGCRKSFGVTDQSGELFTDPHFLQQQLQECWRPAKSLGATGRECKRTRSGNAAPLDCRRYAASVRNGGFGA
jgi:hypothetical protein